MACHRQVMLLPCLFAIYAALPIVDGRGLVFCDVKRAINNSLVSQLTLTTLLPALVDSMNCTGLRIPIMPGLVGPAAYPASFNYTLSWARSRGLALYASPMENSWSSRAAGGGNAVKYSHWLAEFASVFTMDYLSPFNEVGSKCDGQCMAGVTTSLRSALPHPPLLVGPDAEHVATSLALVRASANAMADFDVISSHNAGGDNSNNDATWRNLVTAAGKRPVWSSENPTCFTIGACTTYGTMAASINGGVVGIVSWNTLGDDVRISDGNITDKGRDIVVGLRRAAATGVTA